MAPGDPKSPESIEEIESIRDILFGQQAKQTDDRFQTMENMIIELKNEFQKEQKELRNEIKRLRQEFDKKLASEQEERQKTVLKLLEAVELERSERRQEDGALSGTLSEELQNTRAAFSQSMKSSLQTQIEALTRSLEQDLPAEGK